MDYIDETNDYSKGIVRWLHVLRMEEDTDWHCLAERRLDGAREKENKTLHPWIGLGCFRCFLPPLCIADSCGFVSTYTGHFERGINPILDLQVPLKNRLPGVVDTDEPRD